MASLPPSPRTDAREAAQQFFEARALTVVVGGVERWNTEALAALLESWRKLGAEDMRERAARAEAVAAAYVEVQRHWDHCTECCRCLDCGLCEAECTCDAAGCETGRCDTFDELNNAADMLRDEWAARAAERSEPCR